MFSDKLLQDSWGEISNAKGVKAGHGSRHLSLTYKREGCLNLLTECVAAPVMTHLSPGDT